VEIWEDNNVMSSSIYHDPVNQHNPIKRSPQLAPFSREHHDGLLLVWKIQQGIKSGVDPKRIGAYCTWFWENDLHSHFKREEIALEIVLPKSHPLRNRVEEEHEAIESLLIELKRAASTEVLEKLASQMRDHIRFEERTLFNYIEEVSSKEKLELVYSIINIENKAAGSWEDEFWLVKSPSPQ
jgi:hypothetical protein